MIGHQNLKQQHKNPQIPQFWIYPTRMWQQNSVSRDSVPKFEMGENRRYECYSSGHISEVQWALPRMKML